METSPHSESLKDKIDSWGALIYLWLALGLGVAHASPHQVYNYTWVIENQAGDTVNTSSSIGAQPHWPNLEVDLCALALGANPDWGTPEILYSLRSKAPQLEGRRPIVPGCRNEVERADLHGQAGIYICPGSHRSRSLHYTCGWANDYFCASWGCETTGDTYWNPSSSWDYITVKRKDRHPGATPSHIPDQLKKRCAANNQTTGGWCNPLLIQFTEPGKKVSWETATRGYEWGLRLYMHGRDIGLTFKIKLKKALPTTTPVGPNQVLLDGKKPSQPRPPPLQPKAPNTSVSSPSSGLPATSPTMQP